MNTFHVVYFKEEIIGDMLAYFAVVFGILYFKIYHSAPTIQLVRSVHN
jgi:hypothetical protein